VKAALLAVCELVFQSLAEASLDDRDDGREPVGPLLGRRAYGRVRAQAPAGQVAEFGADHGQVGRIGGRLAPSEQPDREQRELVRVPGGGCPLLLSREVP